MALFQQPYEVVAGGQSENVSSYSRRQARQRRHRRAAIVSGLFALASIVIFVFAVKLHPEWHNPVDAYDPTREEAASLAVAPVKSAEGAALLPSLLHATNSDSADTLPPIDWSWSDTDSGASSPRVGHQDWLHRYPGFVHGPTPRESWLRRYDAALSKGLIPDLPKAHLVGGLANYPADLPNDETLCSYRRASCLAPDDIVRGPPSTWAVNFDDGPLPPSAELYRFLDANGQKATHFWVGNNVKKNPELALQAAKRGDHLAVHTWSHPHLTTYTNEQIVGELGWTMQIIYDVSSHLPKYYRPPFGDVDNRVRAIATHVFNMTAVMWNFDSWDWSLNQTWASGDFVDPPFPNFVTEMSTARLTERMADNDRVNGEGVIALEHELSFESVQAFTDSYPTLKQKDWRWGTVPDLLQLPWYQ